MINPSPFMRNILENLGF